MAGGWTYKQAKRRSMLHERYFAQIKSVRDQIKSSGVAVVAASDWQDLGHALQSMRVQYLPYVADVFFDIHYPTLTKTISATKVDKPQAEVQTLAGCREVNGPTRQPHIGTADPLPTSTYVSSTH